MYTVVMTPSPEDAVERALVAIRRRQSRRVLAAGARRQGFSADLIATAEILDAIDDDAATGPERTVTGIAQRLRMDQPRASRLVAKTIADGLLERTADQRDGRRSLLTLTAAGHRQLDGIRANGRFQAGQAMADWTAGERDAFADLLTRFVSALD